MVWLESSYFNEGVIMVMVKRKLQDQPVAGAAVNVPALAKAIKRQVSGVYEDRMMSVLKKLAKR